jgi:DNA-binding response OmpR family regulator
LSSVWNRDMDDTRTIDLHLGRLRKKLGLSNVIKTLPKVGYLFEV